MIRKLISILVATTLVTGFAFASGQTEGAGEAAGEEPITLTWASVSVTEDAHTQGMFEFERVLEEITDGQIQVEVYPNGELYNQDSLLPALRRGNLDMAYTGPNWIAQFVPYMSMFAAPYIFTSVEHMSQTFNGDIGEEIFDDIAQEVGVRPLGGFYLGTRQVNLRDIGREVRTPADMEGVKLRMPNTPTWQFMGETLGANPTPLAFSEVYLALQTGTIDGQDNPLPTDYNAKFYEVTKYIVLTDHFVNPILPTMSEQTWQSLSADQQAAVLEALEAAREVVDTSNLEREAELVDFFEGEGMTIIEPDKEAFSTYALDMVMNNEELTSTWNMDLFERVQDLGESLE